MSLRRARSVVKKARFIRPRGLWGGVAALGGALFLQSLAGAASAAPVYTVQVTQDADLGVITSAATGDTVFRVDPNAGMVTTVSGTATRTSNGPTRAMVTVSCAATSPGDCTNPVNIKLGVAGSGAGRARALARITFIMGTAQLVGGPGLPGSGSFTLAAIGPNSSKTFFVGADFDVAGDDSGLPTGHAEADFFAFAAEAPAAPTSGATGRFQATIIRSIAIAKTSDLVFGRVVKPLSGAGTVTIDATSGARTLSGAQGLDTPTPSRAAFNVTGEGGQVFSVTVPATFDMTGPQTMTVTTTSSVGATATLSSSLGSAGSLTVGVGGTAPINASTPNGDYSGSFIVTVAYN
jgi:hypothetical protein